MIHITLAEEKLLARITADNLGKILEHSAHTLSDKQLNIAIDHIFKLKEFGES